MISHGEMLLRIGVGAALGGVIGYERDRHRRPVGLRTHLIVALAASTFMVVSSQFVYFQHYAKDDLVQVDTSRISASVVTGIGFLAGGEYPPPGAHRPGAHDRGRPLARDRHRLELGCGNVRRERGRHGHGGPRR